MNYYAMPQGESAPLPKFGSSPGTSLMMPRATPGLFSGAANVGCEEELYCDSASFARIGEPYLRESASSSSDHMSETNDSVSSQGIGNVLRCVGPHGCAFRAGPEFTARWLGIVKTGETILVMEQFLDTENDTQWVRESKGWVPLVDPRGDKLFETE